MSNVSAVTLIPAHGHLSPPARVLTVDYTAHRRGAERPRTAAYSEHQTHPARHPSPTGQTRRKVLRFPLCTGLGIFAVGEVRERFAGLTVESLDPKESE